MTTRPTKQGAVVVLVYMRNGEPHVVFTKRTNNVAAHKGEISFPGGAYETEDASLLETALRETAEELGVDLRCAQVLGKLDDVPTATSGFVIAPFVIYVDSPPVFRPDPFEVAEVFDVPLKALLDPSVFHEEEWDFDGEARKVQFYRHKDREIWGATARILRQFLQLYETQQMKLPAPSSSSVSA